MIPEYRAWFNQQFTEKRYNLFLQKMEEGYVKIPFRIAETPVFIPNSLKQQLIEAGEDILKVIRSADFKARSETAIPKEWYVPNENDHPHFLAFDFAVSKDANQNLMPMLIEMQGFPSLYGFQHNLALKYREVYNIDSQLSHFFPPFSEERYLSLLKKVIVGDCKPEEVILMDIDALNQKTAIDFLATANYLGIKVVSMENLRKDGRTIYYECDGQKKPVQRIYNRLIFDEVADRPEIFKSCIDPREEFDVEWITHPNWFYRISKHALPLLKTKYVPESYLLSELEQLPENLDQYVLKPLFSFAGQGVIIDVKPEDISKITDPQNWILQKKVVYDPVIESPNGSVKVEIRLLYLWADGAEPELCITLARLSRGKMIGVRYNENFDWVGGSVAFMP